MSDIIQKLADGVQTRQRKVNIYQFPKHINQSLIKSSVLTIRTIGDLHANAIKLLHFLVQENIFEMDEDDYEELSTTYQEIAYFSSLLEQLRLLSMTVKQLEMKTELSEVEQDQLNKTRTKVTMIQDAINQNYSPDQLDEFIRTFDEYLNGIKVCKTEVMPRIRLIGDELGDRGACDYFVIAIFQKLFKEQIPFTVLLSNHNMSFFEKFFANTQIDSLAPEYRTSLQSMQYLMQTKLPTQNANNNNNVEKTILSEAAIKKQLHQVYFPNLKLIDADVVGDTIIIYGHSRPDLNLVRAYAHKFGVDYKDKTTSELKNTIELINQEFQRSFVQNEDIHHSYQTDYLLQTNVYNIDKEIDPVAFGIWNRNDKLVDCVSQHNGYHIIWVHGHDADMQPLPNVVNLDDLVGKVQSDDGIERKQTILTTTLPTLSATLSRSPEIKSKDDNIHRFQFESISSLCNEGKSAVDPSADIHTSFTNSPGKRHRGQ